MLFEFSHSFYQATTVTLGGILESQIYLIVNKIAALPHIMSEKHLNGDTLAFLVQIL